MVRCGGGKWCTICRTRPDDLVNHRLECEGDLFPCRVCDISFQTRALRLVHEKECRRPDSSVTARNVRARLQKVDGVLVGGASIEQENQMDVSVDDQIAGGSNTEQENHTVTSITALDGLFRKYTLSPPSQIGTDFHGALIHSIDRFTEIIESNLGTGIKFGLEISLNISRHSTGASATRPFDSQMMPLLLTDPVEPVIRMQIDIICARIERLIRDGSGWAVIDVNIVSIRITK